VFDFKEVLPRPEAREERTVRQEQTETVIGMTHRAFNSLAELCRIEHHRKNLLFWLDDSGGDLARMSRIAVRVDESRLGLERHRSMVRSLYPEITRGIVDKFAGGKELTDLEVFLLKMGPYLTDLLDGKRTIYDLDREYDWERGCFPDGERSGEEARP
jgi:hypothetical protein